MNIYKQVEKKADLTSMPIERSVDVTVSEVSSGEIVLKNNHNGKFLLLSSDEFFIWEKIKEKIYIKDVAVAFFLERGKYAREYVLRVIHTFYVNGFLKNRPSNIYKDATLAVEKKGLSHSLKKIASLFFNFKIEIKNIDQVLSWLYSHFFRIFFNKPAFLIYGVLSIVGTVLLVQRALTGTNSFFEVSGSATLGSLAAIIINLILTSVHEAAHAFSTKYFGRKVERGGLLLYLGLPCLFVDTNEIWLSGRKARISVSLAGPISTVVVASISLIAMQLFPQFGGNDILFKVAIWGFIGAIVNLNPLLELDGYYIMIDYFKIPMMRSRSFQYIKRVLSNLVLLKETKTLEWEKIIYGVLSILWSFLSIFVVLWIIEFRGERILKDLANQSSDIIKLIGLGILFFWMVPVVVSILMFIVLKLKKIIEWISRSHFIREPKYTNIVITVIPFLAFLIPYSIKSHLLVVGVSLLFLGFRIYYLKGSQLMRLAKISYLFVFGSLLSNLFAGDYTFYIGLALGITLFSQAIYAQINFRRGLFALNLALLGIIIATDLDSLKLIAPLLCVGLLIIIEAEAIYFKNKTVSQMKIDTVDSDLGKLIHICSKSSKVLFGVLIEYLSRKRLELVIQTSKTKGFEYEDYAFTPNMEVSTDIIKLSHAGRDLVAYLQKEVKRVVGEQYSNSLITALFDNLFWSEKEIFDKYIIPETNLLNIATLDSKSFSKLDFLHSVSLFSAFDKEELTSLADNLQITKVEKGSEIIRKGEDGDKLYIVLEGEVEISSNGTHIATLYERDFFGEVAIIEKCPRTADAFATMNSALLVLDKDIFGGFVDSNPDVFKKMDKSVRVLGFLKSMPFFRALSDSVLSEIATQVDIIKFGDNEIVLKEGESSSDFFIIRDGKCSVVKDSQKLTTLVRGEFFGEMLILRDGADNKATATISTLKSCTFYSLKRDRFKKLVEKYSMLRNEFKLISSRRVLENRYNRLG